MVQYHDVEYHRLLKDILENGTVKTDRTNTGTISLFGNQMRFDLSNNSVPILTTKEINLNSLIHELIWFISGDTNVKYLNDNNVKIWNNWADKDGNLGPVYGKQWRDCPVISNEYDVTGSLDQLKEVINLLKTDPSSRRIMVDSWNVSQLHEMKLPPCHFVFQFWTKPYSYTHRMSLLHSRYPECQDIHFDNNHNMLQYYKIPKGELSCMLTMRSNDMFLGNPFNIAQYAILTHIIAKLTQYDAKELIYSSGDAHIYSNHIPQVNSILERDPMKFPSPTISLAYNMRDIDDIIFDDIKINDYISYGKIKAPVAI